MGGECENDLAEMPKASYINSDIVYELSYEMREVGSNLEKLKRNIKLNPDFISEKQKELWKKQAAAMEEYVRILGERIKDLIGE